MPHSVPAGRPPLHTAPGPSGQQQPATEPQHRRDPPAEDPEVRVQMDIDKEVSKFARNAATTFAPRASGSTGKNPAYKGSLLYTIFEVGGRGWEGGLG